MTTFIFLYENAVCNVNIKYISNSHTLKSFLQYLKIKSPYKCKDQNTDCSICLDKINPNEFIRELYCDHYFHKKCIDKWLINMSKKSENINCPICRCQIELL